MAENDKSGDKPGLIGRLFGRGSAPKPAEEVVAAPEPAAAEPKKSWWQRLSSGLARSSSTIGQGITDVFTKRKLDGAALDDLEDVLIQADLGIAQRPSVFARSWAGVATTRISTRRR